MSVAASQAPQPPVQEKSGFEMPDYVEKIVIPLAALGIAILIPFFTDNQSFIQQCAVAVAYVVMALGLNIVVGFAGLLDLGYVAFFAIGAHVAAYFGSEFRGIHLSFLLIAVLAIPVGALAGGWAVEQTGSVALVYAVIGVLVALLALAFSLGPLGHAERYLPASQPEPADSP